MKIIKELQGNSGSKVFLMQQGNQYFVRKIGNVTRNFERLTHLSKNEYPVVKVLDYKDNILDLEYIQGLDIENYLMQNSYLPLATFIIEIIDKLKNTEIGLKDYTEIIIKKNEYLEHPSKDIVITNVPKIYQQSEYLGDFTLENILYNHDKGFIIIDQAFIEYNSWQFDLAKLNQDLTCKWFLRYSKTNLDSKILYLKKTIEEKTGAINNYLVILMLYRVYFHSMNDSFTKSFLEKSIKELLKWK